MIVKLLTEHHLEFLSLKGDCRGSSEYTPVKIFIVGNLMHWLKSYIPHAFSSDQSEQSLVLSHTLELFMHRPLAQVKLSLEQFTVVLSEKDE